MTLRPARLLIPSSFVLALLAACSSSDDTTATTPPAANTPATVTGVFLDAPVEGLEYAVGTAAKATTNALGEFTCKTGDTVAFSVGGLALGSAPCAAFVTPLTLAGVTDVKNDRVMNRLLTLQSLDDDGDPYNGIRITPEVRTALAGRSLDFAAAAAAFDTALTATLNGLPAQYRITADASRRGLAREHFEDSLASRLGTPVEDSQVQTQPVGSVSFTVTRYVIQAADRFFIPYEGTLAAVRTDFPKGFLPAYGSGLAFKSKAADGTLEFYAITDRGPNADGPKVPNTGNTLCLVRADATCDAKIFPAPSFVPSYGIVTVGRDGAVLKSSTTIKSSATVSSTGLSLPATRVGSSGEVPLTDALRYEPSTKTTFSDVGIDTESIVVDTARNALWVSDEYGPFIMRIDPTTGVIQKKYAPAIPAGSTLTVPADVSPVLPAVLGKRRANRGMEGLALDVATGRIHGFLQSPLTDLTTAGAPRTATYVAPTGCAGSGTGQRVERFARFTRWIEFDPTTETTKMYAYPINCAEYQDGRTGNAKLGDMVSIGGGKFIVIEQGAGPSGAVFNKLMLVEIGSATDISAAAFNPTTSDLEQASMAGASVNGVALYSTVVPLKKTVLLDLNATGWTAEKAEGLALVDANTLALVNDNDFGLRNQVYDAAGFAIAGADITACTSTNGVLSACGNGVSSRVARGLEGERQNRLWLFKFTRPLAQFTVPTTP